MKGVSKDGKRIESCETCRFWGDRLNYDGELRQQQNELWVTIHHPCKRGMKTDWVSTLRDDWCGQYEPFLYRIKPPSAPKFWTKVKRLLVKVWKRNHV